MMKTTEDNQTVALQDDPRALAGKKKKKNSVPRLGVRKYTVSRVEGYRRSIWD